MRRLSQFLPGGTRIAAPALLALLLALTALGQGAPNGPSRGTDPRAVTVTATLALGEVVPCPGDPQVKVILKTVLADSRCPEGVRCIRAGGVRVELAARRGDETPSTFVLDTDRDGGSGEACGLRFRIVRVEPQKKPGETIPQDRYRITIAARSESERP